MRRKMLNEQALLEFFCFFVFGVLIYYLVSSGKYLNYVTPRMAPYLYFTAFIMFVWACTQLLGIFRLQHKMRSAHCLVLLIPSLLILLPHRPINASDLTSKYVGSNIFTDVQEKPNSEKKAQIGNTTPLYSITTETGSFQNKTSNDNAFMNEKNGAVKKLVVKDDEFYSHLVEISNNMEKYDGYQIEIKGFVYKDTETMSENEFVAARLSMMCCSADLAPLGLICTYDNTSDLKQDEWVLVEGVLYIDEHMGAKEPKIKATKITSAEMPLDEYIYPY